MLDKRIDYPYNTIGESIVYNYAYILLKRENIALIKGRKGEIRMEKKGNVQILTSEGKAKYERELEELKAVRRAEVAEKIKEARDHGDLSENAEYDAARDEQRDIEARIEELKKILGNSMVVDADEENSTKVSIGRWFKVLDVEFEEELEYKIVGPTEANSVNGLISNECPVGKALLNHEVGDVVVVETPSGSFEYKILEIM